MFVIVIAPAITSGTMTINMTGGFRALDKGDNLCLRDLIPLSIAIEPT